MLWGVVVGRGTGMTAIVLGATVVNRWFVERRAWCWRPDGEHGHGATRVPADAGGDRCGGTVGGRPVLIVRGVAVMVVPLVGRFMRDRPSDVGLRPYGAGAPDSSRPRDRKPVRRRDEALGVGCVSGDFWLLAGSFFVCGASTNGLIGTHLIPACLDYGIPEVQGAGLLAAMGIFDLAGTTASGWLSDRQDNRTLLCWYMPLRGWHWSFCRSAGQSPRGACRSSPSSTGWTGSPRCRRPSGSRPTPSARPGPASCSAGSWRRTSSERRPRLRCRCGPVVDGRLPAGLPHLRRPLLDHRGDGSADRPAAAARVDLGDALEKAAGPGVGSDPGRSEQVT